MADDSYRVSACVEGTDCTDCGGVDAIPDYTKVTHSAIMKYASNEYLFVLLDTVRTAT